MPKVTSLDPRTPHQPVKLQKLSKNDYGFTPLEFLVNRKIKITCALFSIECSWFTGVCSATGAATHTRAEDRSSGAVFGGFFKIINLLVTVQAQK
ncbi:MAG: hypothetical protein ACRD3P_09325 [Terriglobales bacterium]